jgi:hypothetical protein
MHFRVIFVRESASHGQRGIARDMPNDPKTRAPFMNPKPRPRFRWSQ